MLDAIRSLFKPFLAVRLDDHDRCVQRWREIAADYKDRLDICLKFWGDAEEDVESLNAKLKAATAENARLRAELEAARHRNWAAAQLVHPN